MTFLQEWYQMSYVTLEDTRIDDSFFEEDGLHLRPRSLPERAIDCENAITNEISPDAVELFSLAICIDIAQNGPDVVWIGRENEPPGYAARELGC
jgi:hypothetical protein